MHLANHVEGKVVDTQGKTNQVRLLHGALLPCDTLEFLVLKDDGSGEFRSLLTQGQLSECRDKMNSKEGVGKISVDKFGIITYKDTGLVALCVYEIPSINPNDNSLARKSAGAKTGRQYTLVVYLDGASQKNVIGDNFKIVVYNSDKETILSEKPTIEFNDNHQKISPKDGYLINYQLGQHPEDIKACAQQAYTMNGKSYLHDDCYPIKQNIQKTYWYTVFDYGQIDGFEGEKQSEADTSATTTKPRS